MKALVTVHDIERAAEIVHRHLQPTPLRFASCLRDHGNVLLKLECWQPTGSYKVRGGLNLLARLSSRERERGVVAASTGNHALGVAFAAVAVGGRLPVTVFIPTTASRAKIEKLRAFDVDVRRSGATYEDAHREAQAFAERTGAVLADPVEDMLVSAGHGTLGLELLGQRKDLSTVLVPVGGGALISGVATAIKASAPQVRIIAVQAEASASLRDSLQQGRALVEYTSAPTLADGLAGGVGQLVFRHRHLIDGVLTVSEDEIEEAMIALLTQDQLVVEGAGAVGVAAILSGKLRADGPTAVVVTGANVDASVLTCLLTHHA